MLIQRVSADWKDGSHSAAEWKDGLNLLESDAKDWPGVVRAALFGADADREGLLRMEMTCRTQERALTISRAWGADAPAFRAEDESGAEAEDLTAENCGEVLTGASRDAYANLACVAGAEAPDLRARLNRSQARLNELEEREAALNQKIRDIDSGQADADGVPDLSVLTAAYAAMKSKLEEDKVPELDAVSHLRGAIVNIMTAGKQLDKAEAEQEAAEGVLAAAKADVDAMPFAGMTPDEAEQSELKLPFKPFVPKWGKIAFGAVVALGALFLFRSPGAWYPVAWILFAALGILAGWLIEKWGEKWEVMAAKRRNQWESDLVRYAKLYRVMEDAQAAADIKIAAADSLRESLSANERGILREIHKFAPEVSTMQEADEQLRLCARRRKELSIAEAVVRKAEALQKAESVSAVPAISVVKTDDKHHVVLTNLPEGAPKRDTMIQAFNATREEKTALRLEVRRDKEELSEKIAGDWEAARRSLDALKGFESPSGDFPAELWARVAEVFELLTDGQHAGRITAESAAALLSGAGGDASKIPPDALAPFRLAVCLACFERALSGENRPPLILRDALAGFDERSRAASVRFLETAAQNRQILFFGGGA